MQPLSLMETSVTENFWLSLSLTQKGSYMTVKCGLQGPALRTQSDRIIFVFS